MSDKKKKKEKEEKLFAVSLHNNVGKDYAVRGNSSGAYHWSRIAVDVDSARTGVTGIH